jgi:hypothetical protein
MSAREQEIKELADQLSRFINSNGQLNKELLADAILRDHRTLQQQTFGFFLTCIRKWAALAKEGESGFDLRNAWTVDVCEKIVAAVEEVKYTPPLI